MYGHGEPSDIETFWHVRILQTDFRLLFCILTALKFVIIIIHLKSTVWLLGSEPSVPVHSGVPMSQNLFFEIFEISKTFEIFETYKIFEIFEIYKMVHSGGSHEPRPSDDRVSMLMVNVDMVAVEVMVMVMMVALVMVVMVVVVVMVMILATTTMAMAMRWRCRL